jgi:hypothetical protein
MIAGHPPTHFDITMLGIILVLILCGFCWPGDDGDGPNNRVAWGH